MRLANFYLNAFTLVGYRNNKLFFLPYKSLYFFNPKQQCQKSYFKFGPPVITAIFIYTNDLKGGDIDGFRACILKPLSGFTYTGQVQ